MTAHRKPHHVLEFNRSGPMVCPYLPDQVEHQLFTELSGPNSQAIFEHLSLGGFRRSHQLLYRPTCNGCTACYPARFTARELRFGKTFKRIRNKGAHLALSEAPARATAEHYSLFRKYIRARHMDGDMAQMSYADFANLVVASPIRTSIFEWRDENDRLVAACITDYLENGLSAVYSFFDPKLDIVSPGTFMILELARIVQAINRKHVYLGFWVPGSPKMDYKNRFQPLEVFTEQGWQRQDVGI